MAISFNPLDILSGFNLTKLNQNFQNIKASLSDGLSRSGGSPNQMEADIDMNGNDLLNVKTLSADVISLDGQTLAPEELVVTGALLKTNNLADVVSVSAARSNLGLGSAALNNTADFATAAQGVKADTALQPNVADETYVRLDTRGYYDLSIDFGHLVVDNDWTAALSAMIDACILNGRIGQIRPGSYNITSGINKSFTNDFQTLEIIGFGNQTQINLIGAFGGSSGNALTINYFSVYNGVRWRDMEIRTDNQATAVTAFNLICPAFAGPSNAYRTEFTGLTFRGTDGVMTAKHFRNMIKTMRVNNVYIDLCDFYGAGLAIGDANGRGTMLDFQSDAPNYAVTYSVKRSKFMQFENAIRLGTYVQELKVDDSEFVGGSYGVLVPATQIANDGIIVYGSHFNCHVAGIGVLATAATNLFVGAGTYFVIDDVNSVGVRNASRYGKVIGCGFEGIASPAGAAGVDFLSGSIGNVVNGNSFSFMPLGILLRSGATFNAMSGNVFDNLTTGVTLQAGADNNKLNLNTYNTVTTPFGNSGAGNSIGVATS